MYEAKDLLKYYQSFLEKMYPTKPIVNIKRLIVDEIFKELLNGQKYMELSETQQQELKVRLKNLITDSKHANEIPHLNTFK